MKNIIILFILSLYSTQSFGQGTLKKITCGFGQCSPEFPTNLYLEKENKTVIDLGIRNNATIEANLPQNQDPRALLIAVENNSINGQNLIVNLNSKKVEKHTEDFTLIGDIFNDININLDGYNGATGSDASILCANKFKEGQYGIDARNYFNARRVNSPSISPIRCDEQDVRYLQDTKFSCQNPGFNLSEFDTVSVNRIKYKQRCIGTSIQNKCLMRKIKLKCEWATVARGFGYSCGKRCYQHCELVYGARNCAYSSSSCWTYDLNIHIPHQDNNYSSEASNNQIPYWSLSTELARCNPKVEPNSYGGWFAYQTTSDLTEADYNKAVAANTVNNICSQFPSPISKNRFHNNRHYVAWKFNRVADAQLTYPGLDPETQNPLPGSNWIVQNSDFFMACPQGFTTLNSKIDNWSTFGEVGNECRDARIPEDRNNLIPWAKAGEEQDPTFGTEKLNCSPGRCPVQNLVQETELTFDTIDPTAGANGTNQGNANLLIYDYKSITKTAQPGIAGNGGRSDLPDIKQNKYCIKIDDSETQGILSSFAKNPSVSFNIYKWQALNVKRGQPGGSNPDFSKNTINIFRKLDSSIRYLIKQESL